MKIIFLTEFFPTSKTAGNITGGVESRVFYLQKYLEKMGHQVKVISRSTKSGVAGTSVMESIMKWPGFIFRCLRQVDNQKFDIIVGESFVCYPIAWIIGRLKNIPAVYCYHDVFLGSWVRNVGIGGIIGEILERIDLSLHPRKFIAVSQSTKGKLVKNGIDSQTIKVVHNGIDKSEIMEIKAVRKKFDICTVTRLVGYKRVDDLIRAVAKVKKSFPRLSVAIVGQGPEEEKLKGLSHKLEVEKNIKFLGYFQRHTEVLNTIKSSRLFCLPSITEGFGISAIEAAGLGVPLVLSNIPALSEVTDHGQGGLLFAPENPDDLAEKLKSLLKNKALYLKKSREVKELAKKYYWENLAKEELKIYQQVVAS